MWYDIKFLQMIQTVEINKELNLRRMQALLSYCCGKEMLDRINRLNFLCLIGSKQIQRITVESEYNKNRIDKTSPDKQHSKIRQGPIILS